VSYSFCSFSKDLHKDHNKTITGVKEIKSGIAFPVANNATVENTILRITNVQNKTVII